MIEKLRQSMIFLRYLGLIAANKSGLNKRVLLFMFRDYLKLKILNLLPKLFKSRIDQLSFLGHYFSFFDLKTTTSLIESIFIENEYFFKLKNKKPNIIDLGSNLGLSIIYFKTLYPNCSIDSYEPDPITFEILSKNIKNYHLRKVTVHNFAVTNKNGFINFHIDKEGLGSPLMSTHPLRIINKKTIRVKSVRLSKIIKKKVDFLKMDIEGSESQVLEDLDSSQKIKLIAQMSIEYHHHIDSKQDNLSKFLKILEKNNFGYQIHAGQNTPFGLQIFEDIQIHAYNKGQYPYSS